MLNMYCRLLKSRGRIARYLQPGCHAEQLQVGHKCDIPIKGLPASRPITRPCRKQDDIVFTHMCMWPHIVHARMSCRSKGISCRAITDVTMYIDPIDHG